MSSDTTLFAHIAPRLTDRTEDVAVDALGHPLLFGGGVQCAGKYAC